MGQLRRAEDRFGLGRVIAVHKDRDVVLPSQVFAQPLRSIQFGHVCQHEFFLRIRVGVGELQRSRRVVGGIETVGFQKPAAFRRVGNHMIHRLAGAGRAGEHGFRRSNGHGRGHGFGHRPVDTGAKEMDMNRMIK